MHSFRFVVLMTVLFSAAVLTAQAPTAPQRATTPPDQVVVTVNGDPVYAGEVQMAAQRMAQSMAQSGQQVDPQQIGQAAMGQMVDGMLLVQEAKKRGFKADPDIIKASVEQAETSAGGPEELDVTLAQQGLDRARLHTLIEDSDLVNQLLQQLGEGVEVSDEEIAAFYEENPTFFEAGEEVSARHILFKVEAGADDETKAAAKAKAEAARKRALEGEDFATLATELSEGPSGPKGGDLGFFTRDRMVAPFADAAFAMMPGETSGVVETQFGYHVIRVEERREARTVPLEEVKDRIRQGLTQEGQGKRVEALLTSLREKAEIVPVGASGAAS
ncbi:MAG: peptidylprolyl isomerase [Acidobacteriota bacterium]